MLTACWQCPPAFAGLSHSPAGRSRAARPGPSSGQEVAQVLASHSQELFPTAFWSCAHARGRTGTGRCPLSCSLHAANHAKSQETSGPPGGCPGAGAGCTPNVSAGPPAVVGALPMLLLLLHTNHAHPSTAPASPLSSCNAFISFFLIPAK